MGELIEIILRTDELLKPYEVQIKEKGIEFIKETGKQLLEAKQKIIQTTGDGRAAGFLDWANRKFNMKRTVVGNYIKVYLSDIDDYSLLWKSQKKSYQELGTTFHNLCTSNNNIELEY